MRVEYYDFSGFLFPIYLILEPGIFLLFDFQIITTVSQTQGKFRVRRARVNEVSELPLNAIAVDVKAELTQALIPIGLWHVKELLEEEVRQIAGERYKRQGLVGYDRWGSQ